MDLAPGSDGFIDFGTLPLRAIEDEFHYDIPLEEGNGNYIPAVADKETKMLVTTYVQELFDSSLALNDPIPASEAVLGEEFTALREESQNQPEVRVKSAFGISHPLNFATVASGKRDPPMSSDIFDRMEFRDSDNLPDTFDQTAVIPGNIPTVLEETLPPFLREMALSGLKKSLADASIANPL